MIMNLITYALNHLEEYVLQNKQKRLMRTN